MILRLLIFKMASDIGILLAFGGGARGAANKIINVNILELRKIVGLQQILLPVSVELYQSSI
jgi:hypothetical protein